MDYFGSKFLQIAKCWELLSAPRPSGLRRDTVWI